MSHGEMLSALREGRKPNQGKANPSKHRARMCDGDIGDTRHRCLPAFCQQLQYCRRLDAYLGPSPLKAICLATGQHHPPEALLLALACPVSVDVLLLEP